MRLEKLARDFAKRVEDNATKLKELLVISREYITKRREILNIIGRQTELDLRKTVKHAIASPKTHVALSLLLFIQTFYDSDTISRALELYTMADAMNKAREILRKIEMGAELNLLSITSTPIAHALINVLYQRFFLGEPSYAGTMMFVYGERGCGKTTLSYWSIYSVLSLLGFSHEEAIEIIDRLIVRDVESYIEVHEVAAKLAKEKLMIPFVIFEDAGEVLSKYLLNPVTGGASGARLAAKLGDMETIARGGMGVTIIISHPHRVIKPLREIPGSGLEGFYHDLGRRYTLWLYYPPAPEKLKGRRVGDLLGTVHPTLRTPDELYEKWEDRKILRKLEILRGLRKELEKARESGASRGSYRRKTSSAQVLETFDSLEKENEDRESVP